MIQVYKFCFYKSLNFFSQKTESPPTPALVGYRSVYRACDCQETKKGDNRLVKCQGNMVDEVAIPTPTCTIFPGLFLQCEVWHCPEGTVLPCGLRVLAVFRPVYHEHAVADHCRHLYLLFDQHHEICSGQYQL